MKKIIITLGIVLCPMVVFSQDYHPFNFINGEWYCHFSTKGGMFGGGHDITYVSDVSSPWHTSLLCYAEAGNIHCDTCSISTTVHNTVLQNINIYPNPTSGLIFIDSDDINKHYISIYSHQGKIVKSEIISPPAKIDISHLVEGLYIMHISTGTDNYLHKIIISR